MLRRGRTDRDAVAGWTLGGRLRIMRASLFRTQPRQQYIRATVSRASRPARSRSGAGASAGRMQRRRVRAVSARLETVQKVLTDYEVGEVVRSRLMLDVSVPPDA